MSRNVIEWPEGDLEPALRLQLKHNGGRDPVNLTGAEKVTVTIRRLAGGKLAYSRDAVFIDRAAGIIDVIWQPGDPVQTRGDYRLSTRISWPTLRPQTVPTREADAWTMRVFRADA